MLFVKKNIKKFKNAKLKKCNFEIRFELYLIFL